MNVHTVRTHMVVIMTTVSLMAVAGPKFEVSDDAYLQAGILGQVHGTYTDNTADKEDIYLRRARVILFGQVMDGVKFFVETDNDNAGKAGKSGVSTDIQDAFIDICLTENNWLEIGLILLPFSFETKSSAASLLGIDYNSEVIKLANTFVWRDNGAELHGSLGKKIAYRAGVFDGYDADGASKNSEAELRYTGHIAVNVIGDVQTGWFYSQERLSDAPYLSIGIGGDYQEDATRMKSIDDTTDLITGNEAYVIDFQSGCKLGALGVTLNGAWYKWDNAVFKGDTLFTEAGLRYKKLQLTAKVTNQDPDSGESVGDTTVGLNYFMQNHNARGGIEYRSGDSPDQILVGMQFLL